MDISLAHISDTHVGFTQYPKKAPSGRGQREQDFVRAFAQAVNDIDALDPPLVLHSGDFFDRPVVSLRHQKQGQAALEQLSTRPDGSTRVTVVISGNHDQPSDPREPCALELDTPIPGVIVVTSAYQVIDLGELVAQGLADPSLAGVVLHAIPHDVLRTVDFDEVVPTPGRTNILIAHGVIGGSDMYKRTIGREYALPIEVVIRGWDYVAMGHWHKRGPVAVGGLTDATTPIWYAGSVENNGFADLTDGLGTGRGYLHVTVKPGVPPVVRGVDLPIRAMFRLPTIDLDGMSPDQMTQALLAAVAGSVISGAVVSQPVTGVTRDQWSLVDIARVRSAAHEAIWYEANPRFTTPDIGAGDPGSAPGDDLSSVLARVSEEILGTRPEKDAVMALCQQLLSDALATSTPTDEQDGS